MGSPNRSKRLFATLASLAFVVLFLLLWILSTEAQRRPELATSAAPIPEARNQPPRPLPVVDRAVTRAAIEDIAVDERETTEPFFTVEIVGTVVRGDSGAPVHGAQISVVRIVGMDFVSSAASAAPTTFEARSDKNGEFRLPGLPIAWLMDGKSLRLLSHAPGFLPGKYVLSGAKVSFGEGETRLDPIRLDPVRTGRLRVVDDFGQPVAGARVHTWTVRSPRNPGRGLQTRSVGRVFLDDPESITGEKGEAQFSLELDYPPPSISVNRDTTLGICIERPGYAPSIIRNVESDDLEVVLRTGRTFSMVCENIPDGEVASINLHLESHGVTLVSQVTAMAPEIELPDLVTYDVGVVTCTAKVTCDLGVFAGKHTIDRSLLRQIVRLDRTQVPVHVRWEEHSPGDLMVALYVRDGRGGSDDRIRIRGLHVVQADKERVSFIPSWRGTLMAMGYSRQHGLFRGQGPWHSGVQDAAEVTIQLEPATDFLAEPVLKLQRQRTFAAVGYRLVLRVEIPTEWTFGTGLPEFFQLEARTDDRGEARLGKLPPTSLIGVAISPEGEVYRIERVPVTAVIDVRAVGNR